MVLVLPLPGLLLPMVPVYLFITFVRKSICLTKRNMDSESQEPGLAFFFEQQQKTADEVVASIQNSGGKAESWEGDLRYPQNVQRLFEQAEKVFGQVDILVNNAAEYLADTFLPANAFGEKDAALWGEDGPTTSTMPIAEKAMIAISLWNTRGCSQKILKMSAFARRINREKDAMG